MKLPILPHLLSSAGRTARRRLPSIPRLSAWLAALMLAATSVATAAKTGPTVFTDERVTAARENIERYSWARQIRDDAVATADNFLEPVEDLEQLWNLPTPQAILRASIGNATNPRTGEQADWHVDPFEDPWKVVDRNTGDRFPSNDFESYYHSGLDESGNFDPDRADDAYLKNELYPDKPEDWGVDDGYSWRSEEGERYRFIGYYNSDVWRIHVWQRLRAFSNAYVFTGDPRYARPGVVLLDRVADYYGDLDLREMPHRERHGARNWGKITGSIGEAYAVYYRLLAYDAFFDYIGEDLDLVEKIGRLSSQFPEVKRESADAIRRHIDTGFIQSIRPGVERASIRGNFGHHQRALAASAVVSGDPEYTRKTLEFLLRPGYMRVVDGERVIDGGQLLEYLVSIIDRDGFYWQSTHYNHLPWNHVNTIAWLLEGYPGYDGPSFQDNVKFKKLHEALPTLIALDRYLPYIGNSVIEADFRDSYDRSNLLVDAFDRWGDPFFAQAAYLHNGNTSEGLRGNIFSADAGTVPERVQAVIDEHGPLDLPSTLKAGYGVGILRDGQVAPKGDDHRRAFWMSFDRAGIVGHNYWESLNIGLFAHRMNVIMPMGDRREPNAGARPSAWTNNTISHNTVAVDDRRQSHQWVGRPKHFDHTEALQLIDVESPESYPEIALYRRTAVQVEIDDENSYVADFFWVHGGNEHLYSFHAAEGAAEAHGLNLVEQAQGTYLGEEHAVGAVSSGRSSRDPKYGYDYLFNVERDATPPEAFSIEWNLIDTWNAWEGEDPEVRVRLTMLGDFDEVALADGNPPQSGQNPEKIRYVLARRSGENHQSAFASIIEAYRGERAVKNVSAVSAEGAPESEVRAIRIDLANGRTDYIAAALDPERVYTVDDRFRFRGFFARYSERDGRPMAAYLHNGEFLETTDPSQRLIDLPHARVTGTVTDFTRELSFENEIVVKPDHDLDIDPADLAGRWIFIETVDTPSRAIEVRLEAGASIHSDGRRNGAYRILDANETAGGEIRLDIGDVTTVREQAEPEGDWDKFIHNIEEGASFVIPLSAAH